MRKSKDLHDPDNLRLKARPQEQKLHRRTNWRRGFEEHPERSTSETLLRSSF